jgi:hypothetical protein
MLEMRRGKRASVFPSIFQRLIMHSLLLAQYQLIQETLDIPFETFRKET